MIFFLPYCWWDSDKKRDNKKDDVIDNSKDFQKNQEDIKKETSQIHECEEKNKFLRSRRYHIGWIFTVYCGDNSSMKKQRLDTSYIEIVPVRFCPFCGEDLTKK